MKQPYAHGLPPCPMSAHCLRLLDDLDTPSKSQQLEELTFTNDVEDERLVEQLRAHVPNCPTCSVTLAQARRTRAQQRRLLSHILRDNEQKVPSTTANIMAAIQREQQTAQTKVAAAQKTSSPAPFPQVREIATPRPKKSRRRLYNALALIAVAAALIASFGLLSFLVPHGSVGMGTTTSAGSSSNSSAKTGPRYSPSAPATTNTWSAVIITYKLNSMTVIANYDPVTGTSTLVASLPYGDTIVDGVSHDGHEVLYSVYDGSKTSYYIYPQAITDTIFTTPDKSLSAIWSTDDRTLFISTAKGVMTVDVQTHAVKLLFPMLPSVTLLNYRDDGYLYFVKGNTGQTYATQGTFNRINIAQGVSQQITPCVHGTNFWLSPSGATVYYNCFEQNADILYAVKSDGSNPHVFRSSAGNIIGYAEDGSPLTLVNANGKYQVVRRDLNTEQDTVLIQDVAPEAITVTADDVAVAPFGQTLVAKTTYSNKGQATHEQFWYSNLTTGNGQTFFLPQGASMSQVIGWDKLQVPGEMLSPTP